MLDQVVALLARHLPDRPALAVTRLGEGWDHVVYQVDGDLLVRIRKETDPRDRQEPVRREAALLSALAEWAVLPTPDLVFADPAAGALAYRKLPGVPLSRCPAARRARPAAALGALLGRLHRVPPARVAHLVPCDDRPPERWLPEAERDHRRIAPLLPAADRRRVEDFLGRTPPPAPAALAFCHNDLAGEHVLVDAATGAVTGIIDWTDAAVADPARDLALLYRDLGPDLLDLVLAGYDGPWHEDDHARAVFYARCTLLGDIAYGLRTGEHHYIREGLAQLPHTFA